AATIMICVFLAFSFGGQRDIAEFGIGLAAAVALDAFILRTVLVPAAMHLFGDANWWLPRWLQAVFQRPARRTCRTGPARAGCQGRNRRDQRRPRRRPGRHRPEDGVRAG